jgi:hypothetical protein
MRLSKIIAAATAFLALAGTAQAQSCGSYDPDHLSPEEVYIINRTARSSGASPAWVLRLSKRMADADCANYAPVQADPPAQPTERKAAMPHHDPGAIPLCPPGRYSTRDGCQ